MSPLLETHKNGWVQELETEMCKNLFMWYEWPLQNNGCNWVSAFALGLDGLKNAFSVSFITS